MQTQGTQDQNSGSYSRTFNSGTRDEVELAVDWPPGQTLNMLPCAATMNEISAGCDNPANNNPRNWKGGGSKQVGIGLFHINPKVVRSPHPTAFCPVCVCLSTLPLRVYLHPISIQEVRPQNTDDAWNARNVCGDICPDGVHPGVGDPKKGYYSVCLASDALAKCEAAIPSMKAAECWVPPVY